MDDSQPDSSSAMTTDIQQRTRGIEVHNLSYRQMDLTIWDMAGQEEFHSFHDLVIPNLSGAGSSCTFILVCNPFERSRDEIRAQLRYWLQFIASNTRKSRSYRPRVTIVMTHYDLWYEKEHLDAVIEEEVEALKEQFQDLLEFDARPNFFPMDARQANETTEELFDHVMDRMKKLLAKLPKVLKACLEVQAMVKDWNMTHPNQPFVSWDAFSRMCEQVEELRASAVDMELVERRRKVVALALHDGGHIIHNKDVGFVIMNPHWFCHDVMGELIAKFQALLLERDLKLISEGSITTKNFRRILSRLSAIGVQNGACIEEFIRIMMNLQMCYDQGDGRVMVPSTLPASGELLKWSSCDATKSYNYLGRRLVPQDMERTILSAGFFPRLQVYFRGKLKDDNTRNSYRLTKDTIFFIENGKEVFVEYDGHIDVMVRSTENKDMLLRFVQKEVFGVIYDLLRNPTLGCPGVVLVECILRPLCVKNLTKKEHRREQCVLVERLKREVLKCHDLNYCHNWVDAREWGLEQSYDNAQALLGRKEWKDVFRRCGRKFPSHMASAVDSNAESRSDRHGQGIESISFQLQGIKSMLVSDRLENRTMHEEQIACVNELTQFSIELQRTQIPRLAWIAIPPDTEKKRTWKIPGLTKCTLRFFCEYIYGIHEVENQEGYPLKFGTEETKRVLSLIAWGLKVATILAKVAAHVGVGMGSSVPELVQVGSSVLDTPGLLEYLNAKESSLKILPQGLDNCETISDEDMKDTERWVIEMIKSKQADIYKMFKLSKVKYNRPMFGDEKNIPSIAWVCDKHRRHGLENGTLVELSY